MTSQLHSVFWIAGVGTAVLFVAQGLLVGLMYLLTWPRLYGRQAVPRGNEARAERAEAVGTAELAESMERGRRLKAAAVAAAIAVAQVENLPGAAPAAAPSAWTMAHRAGRVIGHRVVGGRHR